MLKNVIESADYYFGMRKRRYNPQCSFERRFYMMQTSCGASTMAVFHHPGLCFDKIICNSKVNNIKTYGGRT
jgi:hypothetical protein